MISISIIRVAVMLLQAPSRLAHDTDANLEVMAMEANSVPGVEHVEKTPHNFKVGTSSRILGRAIASGTCLSVLSVSDAVKCYIYAEISARLLY